jgi:hypothetical protein
MCDAAGIRLFRDMLPAYAVGGIDRAISICGPCLRDRYGLAPVGDRYEGFVPLITAEDGSVVKMPNFTNDALEAWRALPEHQQ